MDDIILLQNFSDEQNSILGIFRTRVPEDLAFSHVAQ